MRVYAPEGLVTMFVFVAGSSVVTPRGVRVGDSYQRLVELVGPLWYGEEEALWRAVDEAGMWAPKGGTPGDGVPQSWWDEVRGR